MQFPKMVYTSPGPYECKGGTFGCEAVKDENEFNSAIDAGFFATLPEAVEEHKNKKQVNGIIENKKEKPVISEPKVATSETISAQKRGRKHKNA